MLKRYNELNEFLPLLELEKIDLCTQTASENRHIDNLLMLLGELQSVSLELQKEKTTIAEFRALFDETVEEFPTLINRLGSAANIIQCKDFEDGLVLLQQGKEEEMSGSQHNAVKGLKEGSVQERQVSRLLSLAERALKVRKVSALEISRRYKDTRFIVPKSTAV